jgi:hypothetical protein
MSRDRGNADIACVACWLLLRRDRLQAAICVLCDEIGWPSRRVLCCAALIHRLVFAVRHGYVHSQRAGVGRCIGWVGWVPGEQL